MQTCVCVPVFIPPLSLLSLKSCHTAEAANKGVDADVGIHLLPRFSLPTTLKQHFEGFSALLILTEFIHERRKLSIPLLFSFILTFVCSMVTHKVIELKSARVPKSNENLTSFSSPVTTVVLRTVNILDLLIVNLEEGRSEVLQWLVKTCLVLEM